MHALRNTPPSFSVQLSSFSVEQGGFTLIESMIALMVISVGLLGVAAMQDIALSRNVDANQLSLATNLASDMIERIRYNRVNVSAYAGIDTLKSTTRPTSVQAQGDYDQWSARLGDPRLATSGMTNVQGLVGVTAIGPQGSSGLNQSQVAVQVVWTGTMMTHTVTLGTVVAPE